MPLNNIIDYFETDASNVDVSGIGLSDNTQIDQLDDIARAQMGALARFTGAETIASATTTSIATLPGQYVEITGTTTITGLGTIREGIIKFVRFAGVLTLTHNATSLILPGAANITTAAGDTAVFVSKGSGNWECLDYNRADGTALVVVTPTPTAPPKGHLFGLTLTTNGTDASNDIDIAAGEAASDATTPVLLTLSSALTKRLDASWTVGTNQGGLDTGSVANSRYAVWLIGRSDTSVVDVLFSLSFTAPTMPTNYDRKVLLGEVTRASAVNGSPLWYGPRRAATGFEGLTLMEPLTATSGTSQQFLNIPPWAKRITIMLNSVSTNGTNALVVQIGTSAGFLTSSYDAGFIEGSSGSAGGGLSGSGFYVASMPAPTAAISGSLTFSLLNPSINNWVADGGFTNTNGTRVYSTSGSRSLPGVLDRVRLTSVGGTDVFDAGFVNIIYE